MSTSPATGPLRIARSGLLVVVTFALASLAHTTAGGHLPSPFLLTSLAVLVACVAYLVTGRKVSPRTTALFISVLQVLLHQAFSVLGGHGTSAPPVAGGAVAPHAHLHATAVLLPKLPSIGAGDVALAPHPGLGSAAAVTMLALHVLATAGTVIALAGGERAVWQLWAWLRPLVALLIAPAQFPVHRRISVVEAAGPGPVLLRVGRRRQRRGPPPMKWLSVPA